MTTEEIAVCANCGHAATGSYCADCGQETAPPPGVREILRDTIIQLLSLESKAWQTLSRLVAIPGGLTAEYLAGRRARYIRPLRLYLWISVLTVSITELFGLHLGLMLSGEEGIYLFDTTRDVGGQGEHANSLRPMHFVLTHFDTPGLQRFKALPADAQLQFVLEQRHQILKYFMLVLVPVFALLLQCCYCDRRWRFSEFLVFSLHSQSFLLIALLVEAVLPVPIALLVSAWSVAYFFLALNRVFGGRWAQTLLRGSVAIALDVAIFFLSSVTLVYVLLVS